MRRNADHIPIVQRLVDRGTPITRADHDAMDDEVDLWHLGAAPARCELHEWLGMTWHEYGRWVMSSLQLDVIVEERRRAQAAICREL